MKKKNIRNLIISILVLVMTMSLMAGCQQTPTETTGNTEPTDPPKPVALNYDLYFNKSTITRYSVDDTDGTVHMTLYNKGLSTTVRAADLAAAGNIAAETIFALVRNEDNLVVDVQTVEEIGATYVAKWAYITEVSGNDITVNGDTKFTLNANTILTDTTGNTTIGNSVKLRVGDCVAAIANSNDEVTHVFVVSAAPKATKTAKCEHCDKEVTWTGWTGDNNKVPTTTGHYYLVNDMTAIACTIAASNTVCLDLNGYTISVGTNQRLYGLSNADAVLALMDTSADKTGTIKTSGGYANVNGALVFASKGDFYMYGGTLDASNLLNNGYGAVYIAAGYTFQMKDGKIVGLTTAPNEGGTGGYGGAVYATGAKTEVIIDGGEIVGGDAQDAFNHGKGKGGAIYMGANTILTINGGTVTSGKAVEGPCVWANTSATVTIADAAEVEDVFPIRPETPAEPAA